MKAVSAAGDHSAPRNTASATLSVAPSSTLGQLSGTMDEIAYEILVDLVAWANLIDDLYNQRVDERGLDDARLSVMMKPFAGFGSKVQGWGIYSPAVTSLISTEMVQWWSDTEYRKANSMTWIVLSKVSYALATASKGWEVSDQVTEILSRGFKQ